MKYTDTFKEARRLHKLGFAIHWLHERSKRPIESGWTTGPRKTWEYLAETYVKGLNVGVRLGTPSKLGSAGYLAVVDVDVKSKDERHRNEAVRAAKALLGGADCPCVRSGRGNGSRHYYCVTADPFKTFNPAVSEEKVKVFMPSKKPSKKELESLSEAEIAEGLRIAPAWEISLYSDGRQVVLPPSLHPDSGKPYQWTKHVTNVESLPLIEFTLPAEGPESSTAAAPGASRVLTPLNDFEVASISPMDLEWLPISDKMRRAIMVGDGVGDRSGFLLPAATALLSAGLDRDEILTVLTDPNLFLGACAYDHAKTTSRKRAAHWLWKYTVKRVMEERSAEAAFAGKAIVSEPKLSPEEVGKQAEELEAESDWRSSLERTDKGKYRNTLNNCKLIMSNVCGQKNIVGRNEFAANDYYLCNTPWRSRNGDAVVDHDIVRIKFFCAERFGVEFSDNVVNQSLMEIADRNRFHPVREWLEGLVWDGKDRIDTWLKDYAGADGPEPYLSDVSRKTLVAMVKRVFEPGCKYDHVLILEGGQGTGKSTLLRKLSEPWFSDATLNIGDKDAVLTMQSKWLIELGELSSMGKADVEQLKAFITQTTDRIRAPYGKRVEEFPRQCVFIGSTNQDEYLKDLTGNRRFWAVKTTGHLNYTELPDVREQLFAEALAYYRLGEPLYLDNEASNQQASAEQAKRMQGDEWLSTVRDIVGGETFPKTCFEIKDVAKRMDQVGAHKMAPHDVHRITRCLKMLGFEKFQESTGDRRRMWRIVEYGEPRGTTPNSGLLFARNTNAEADFL